MNAIVLGFFAAAAVLLAAIGLFAIIATMVRQRTHEFGIRLTLGATGSAMRWMVMARGLALAAVGAAAGLVAASGATRFLRTLLFEVSPNDWTTLVWVTALMLAVAAFASFIPARVTMRIDPVIALRSDV